MRAALTCVAAGGHSLAAGDRTHCLSKRERLDAKSERVAHQAEQDPSLDAECETDIHRWRRRGSALQKDGDYMTSRASAHREA